MSESESGRGGAESQIQFRYGNKPLQKLNDAKYRGITFDNKLSWNTHTKNISEAVRKR